MNVDTFAFLNTCDNIFQIKPGIGYKPGIFPPFFRRSGKLIRQRCAIFRDGWVIRFVNHLIVNGQRFFLIASI